MHEREREQMYLVFLPTECEGINHGNLSPLRITAITYEDALRKARDKWWGGTLLHEGFAVVVLELDAMAFVLGKLRGVEIVQETSLPDLGAEIKEGARN